MSSKNSRGKLTKRGHEFCTDPPLIDKAPRLPKTAGRNILRCEFVQGLEQGLYIISERITAYPNPLNTPEFRHHFFMQVYQDSDATSDINRAQACYDQAQKEWMELQNVATPKGRLLLKQKLDLAKKELETIEAKSNRALMIEVECATDDNLGSIVTIASVFRGQTIKPDLNDSCTVISPILTKSDIEKFEGAKWLDPNMDAISKCVAKIRTTPYSLFGYNCKIAALDLVKAGLEGMSGLTSEMQEIARANMDKTINANVPLAHIIGNTMSRAGEAVAGLLFNHLALPADELPRGHASSNFKITAKFNPEQCTEFQSYRLGIAGGRMMRYHR